MSGGSGVPLSDRLNVKKKTSWTRASETTGMFICLFVEEVSTSTCRKKCGGMSVERRKKQIEISGLPEPWLAYVHLVKKKVFYHNPDTNQSVWELPRRVKKKCRKGVEQEIEEQLTKILSSEESDSLEPMDCTEFVPANSPTEDPEPMEIDFTEDLRQVRGCGYDSETLSSTSQGGELFTGFSGSSRSCVVFDTCALIDDPDLINDCVSKLVFVVIPYRVFYELDRMKKLTSDSKSAVELRRIATRLVWLLRDLRNSPCVYWESSAESFSPVEGFMTSSEEDVNDDFILKCAFRTKLVLDNKGWETVFITNDQLLSLKAHASQIPCFNVKETRAVLDRAPTPVIPGKQEQSSSLEANVSSSSSQRPSAKAELRHEKKPNGSVKDANPVNNSKAHKAKDSKALFHPDRIKKSDKSPISPLKRFERMWKPLIKVLEKKKETGSVKQKRDISRLHGTASSFIRNQSEESLLLLVQMTWWLYYYYYPPPRNEKEKDGYKDIVKDGLLKELCASDLHAIKMMSKLRKFIKDFNIVPGN
ncbi:unnamed protein product [Cylicocyclus nassatus]|uniref:WW domain-containing protein n=1 Tax=Cylicocyclus nassatus TaxID=53992 RepID=A0AA36MCP1_CYLNA|nr:unnamed protein product [Cylicocyclus nassatus]